MCPKYKRYWVPDSVAFLTLVTGGRSPIFHDEGTMRMALGILRRVKEIHPFRMRGYVILPDHWHLLLWTRDGRFDRVVHSFKRNVAFALKREGYFDDSIWQRRYYDHVIRDDADFTRHLDYIHFNPVHHGLAAKPVDHEFSSFKHYVSIGWYPMDWGTSPPDSLEGLNME
jgi:putative transposase